MELREVLRRRRMVRAYDPDRPLDDAVVTRLLSAAVRAPSAGNTQGWDFLALRERADRDLFWDVTTGGEPPSTWTVGLRTAPLLVVCLSHKDAYLDRYAEPDKGWTDRAESRWAAPYWDVDTGMAALLILLTAVDEGLGACLFGLRVTAAEDFHSAFGVPADRHVVGVVSVGHPAPDRPGRSAGRPHRPLREVAHDGRFGTPYPG